ncbi:PD-(D/E)XK nuclease family protein (plasmid) [Microbulbifer sp. TRSA002]|uniref:PD-(D/E)XK nuclease family protein n=1 Tax=Microbulbifer sp. TRSA002 TaxID=3243382 RepID=UPI004039D31D
MGKPDLMYRIRGGILAVEYKSRRGPVFTSDVVQAKCAALAARRNGYQVTQLLVKTSSTEKYIELPRTDRALFEEIKKYVILTRQAKAGVRMNPWPNAGKCRGCAYKFSCQHVMR